jgi:UDP-N-acetylmuramyl pentapeptide phosphotransferase/UDP-N-acetylglucosamine-1-phosphate transferase
MFKDPFFYACISSFFLYILIFSKAVSKYLKKCITPLKNIQHIHHGDVQRLGGLVLFLSLAIFYSFVSHIELKHLLEILLISAIPLWTAALIEDINGDVLHLHRLFGIFLSICVFIFINDFSWPRLSFIGADFLYANPFLIKIIFALVIATVVNGANFIDGMNGLASLSMMTSFLCLFFLAQRADDMIFVNLSLLSLGLIGVFTLFNFPFAKIFLGDSGAYLLGYLLITLLIIFYGRHPELSNWGAAVVVFYFAFEVIFSFFRKIIQKRSPLYPDNKHLHLIAYSLAHKACNKKIANPLTTIILSVIYLQPLFYISFFRPEKIWMGLALLILSLTYILFYILLNKLHSKLG